MSRIGRMPITVPAGVEVKNDNNLITVKGPKGELTRQFSTELGIEVEAGVINVTRPSDDKRHRSLHGLTRTLIANMVEGVTNGYSKTLEIEGVGYRAAKSGNKVTLSLGFSHPVILEETASIKIDVPQPNKLVISGIDKQAVGQFAAEVREKRPPEPYKGKGIRYAGERIIRKEGKAGKGKK
ncbi:MAG: 50S ribosomal protein L6 [Ruminococcus sp.]|uniref:50S ribosomal protein L6 n=1 Tax=uncultured Ruminococcus sp. TaxID=165186 RepID=UPI002602122F|nr:50S ribosomal protein L6 [uncultured Ruminococcus sp.]MCR4862698.1 50S ribosomal protein L6 [Ruminococcus sp.]